jgi:hypothetical protein
MSSIQVIKNATLPTDEVIDQRRQVLQGFIDGLKTDIDAIQQSSQIICMGTPLERDWARSVSNECWTALEKATEINGEDGQWCNGWMGSRWMDTELAGRRTRIAFYAKVDCPKMYADLAKQRGDDRDYTLLLDPYSLDESPITRMGHPMCAICKQECDCQYGHNPYPFIATKGARVCDLCNQKVIIPCRRATPELTRPVDRDIVKSMVQTLIGKGVKANVIFTNMDDEVEKSMKESEARNKKAHKWENRGTTPAPVSEEVRAKAEEEISKVKLPKPKVEKVDKKADQRNQTKNANKEKQRKEQERQEFLKRCEESAKHKAEMERKKAQLKKAKALKQKVEV